MCSQQPVASETLRKAPRGARARTVRPRREHSPGRALRERRGGQGVKGRVWGRCCSAAPGGTLGRKVLLGESRATPWAQSRLETEDTPPEPWTLTEPHSLTLSSDLKPWT